jgi:hypothetical protein
VNHHLAMFTFAVNQVTKISDPDHLLRKAKLCATDDQDEKIAMTENFPCEGEHGP